VPTHEPTGCAWGVRFERFLMRILRTEDRVRPGRGSADVLEEWAAGLASAAGR
jgi:hypothetical protein